MADRPKSRPLRWIAAVVAITITAIATGQVVRILQTPTYEKPLEIYQGVYYQTDSLPTTEHGSGAVHIVTIDFNTPGISLYLTPRTPDPNASYEYTTDYPWRVAANENLAVSINAVRFYTQSQIALKKQFSAKQGLAPKLIHQFVRTADRANATLTVGNQGERDTAHPNWRYIWLDQNNQLQITGMADDKKPMLDQAQWYLGSDFMFSWAYQAHPYAKTVKVKTAPRSVIGIDRKTNRLFLFAFESASFPLIAQQMQHHKVETSLNLDGGRSTCLVLGQNAKHIRGTQIGGGRPVAVTLGIRANPMEQAH